MSLYQVDKLLFALFNDLELQQKYQQDPSEVLKGYDLQDFELKALRDVNAGELYRMGVHSFLLWQFSRLMDLKPAIYFKQVRGE
ncbi:MAG: igA domain-containing protein [Deltaproteobacteria bacterium]|nr:igA domain-containing protein [Deltaproteobacteria bacterium]